MKLFPCVSGKSLGVALATAAVSTLLAGSALAQSQEQAQPGAVAEPQSGQVQDRVTARLVQRRQLFGQSGLGGGIEFAVEKDDDPVIGTAAPRRHIAGVICPASAGRRVIRTALRW